MSIVLRGFASNVDAKALLASMFAEYDRGTVSNPEAGGRIFRRPYGIFSKCPHQIMSNRKTAGETVRRSFILNTIVIRDSG